MQSSQQKTHKKMQVIVKKNEIHGPRKTQVIDKKKLKSYSKKIQVVDQNWHSPTKNKCKSSTKKCKAEKKYGSYRPRKTQVIGQKNRIQNCNSSTKKMKVIA